MGWNPMSGTWEAAPKAPPRGYGTDRSTLVHGTSSQSQALRYLQGSLLPAERGNEQRAAGAWDNYSGALNDIEGTVGRFGDIYQKAGQAIAAPAQRDFNQSQARVGANAASRFGGNVSSEELRQGYNSGDLFSRNLSEALAQLGGQQVNAGLNYTGQLGDASSQSADERDRLRQMIIQTIGYGNKPQKTGGIGGAIGGILGGAAGSFLGPMGTALGSSLGGKIGGG